MLFVQEIKRRKYFAFELFWRKTKRVFSGKEL